MLSVKVKKFKFLSIRTAIEMNNSGAKKIIYTENSMVQGFLLF